MQPHNTLATSQSSFFLATVQVVNKPESGGISQDGIGRDMDPQDILFSAGETYSMCRAKALLFGNEVNVGDMVMIFSTESIFNNNFYFIPVRRNSNVQVNSAYTKASQGYIPRNLDTSDAFLRSGDNNVALSELNDSAQLISQGGGTVVSSNGGRIEISNSEESLVGILTDLVKTIIDMPIDTPQGPGKVSAAGASKLFDIISRTKTLLATGLQRIEIPVANYDPYSFEEVAGQVSEEGSNTLYGDDPEVVITPEMEEKISEYQVEEFDMRRDPNDTSKITQDPDWTGSSPLRWRNWRSVRDSNSADNNNYSPLKDYPIPDVQEKDLDLTPNIKLRRMLGEVFKKSLPSAGRKTVTMNGRKVTLTNKTIVRNLQGVAMHVVEPLERYIATLFPGKVMKVNSGYRSGNGSSQHDRGEAVDIQIPGLTPYDHYRIAKWIVANLDFDQFIFEHGKGIWLHISYAKNSKPCQFPNRKQVLTMKAVNNVSKYEPGVVLYKTN